MEDVLPKVTPEGLMEQAHTGKSLVDMVRYFNTNDKYIYRTLDRYGMRDEFFTALKEAREKNALSSAVELLQESDSLREALSSVGGKSTQASFAKKLRKAYDRGMLAPGICEHCGAEHGYTYGTGLFCARSCARAFSTKNMTAESNERRMAGLQKANEVQAKAWDDYRSGKTSKRPCEAGTCTTDYWTDERKASMSAKTKANWGGGRKVYKRRPPKKSKKPKKVSKERKPRPPMSAETRKKLSAAARKRVKNGTHVGWTSRNVQSYPEKYWESVLRNHGLTYERELVVPRAYLGIPEASNYFLDFVITTANGNLVDLEIDGKQHAYEDRAQADELRDSVLTKAGFEVYRIPWVNPRDEASREFVRNQRDDLLHFLSTGTRVDTNAENDPFDKVRTEMMKLASMGLAMTEVAERMSLGVNATTRTAQRLGIYEEFSAVRKAAAERILEERVISRYLETGDLLASCEKGVCSKIRVRKTLQKAMSDGDIPKPFCSVCGTPHSYEAGFTNHCSPNCRTGRSSRA